MRPALYVWYRTTMRSAFIHPGNLPHCWCLGDRKILQEAWGLVPGEVRVLLVEAESKLTELKSINLGPKRTFTVAESILWTELCGVQFTAEVAATVSLEDVTKGFSKLAGVAKDAAAIRYGNCTANSITNYLSSPVFRKRPKLVHKNTKAATVEAAEVAAKTEAAARTEEVKRLAAEYEAMCGDPLIEARAQAALPGDPLRERWHAFNLLRESDHRANAQAELLSVCEAVAAETAAANAAVAAAATAAAAEAAAASKAAKAAAAANERRARGCGRRKKTTFACALHGALSTRNTSRLSPAAA